MKALTLIQPWASLVAIGAKRIETRSFRTKYRGPLAIHAAKGFPRWALDTLDDPVFYGAFYPTHAATLIRAGVRLVPNAAKLKLAGCLPRGAVIATARLIDCVQMRELNYRDEDGDVEGILGRYTYMIAGRSRERAFGDYSMGRWAWILSEVKCFDAPVPAKGALGLWEWTPPAGSGISDRPAI